jgi:hypothetical protein
LKKLDQKIKETKIEGKLMDMPMTENDNHTTSLDKHFRQYGAVSTPSKGILTDHKTPTPKTVTFQ